MISKSVGDELKQLPDLDIHRRGAPVDEGHQQFSEIQTVGSIEDHISSSIRVRAEQNSVNS